MVKRNAYIYKITSPSNKIYIGQTIDITTRISKYKTLKCKSQPRIYNSLNKYGWNFHIFEIIEQFEYLDYDIINEREIYWINFYNTLGEKGLNCRSGGKNYIMSDETKEKLRQINLGKTPWNKGQITPDIVKEKIRQSSIGKHTKEKNGFYNKKHSEEAKEKMRLNHFSPKTKKCISTPDNIIFDKLSDAEKYYNITNVCVFCKTNKLSKKSGQYFNYYEQIN